MDTQRVKRKSTFCPENGPSAETRPDDKKSAPPRGHVTKMTFSSFAREGIQDPLFTQFSVKALTGSKRSRELQSIYSVDVHPDGSRFAAGGPGDSSSGRVAVFRVSLKDDRPEAELISQTDEHSACVSCVRWSKNGHQLASSAADNLIMIWHPVFSNEQETWRRAHVLRLHSGDVLTVAWSPNDSMLASCSVDNKIVIWNAVKAFQILKVLEDCQTLVKGVTWDPIGRFLAAQDDQSLRIWRTYDWKQERVITEQFDKDDNNAQFLRLDWSTDGTSVISAHASNGGVPVAQIIERTNKWNNKLALVGHARPIVCVRFNPRMFVSDSQRNSPYCVFATGGRDNNLIVWNYRDKRPHAFLGLFKSPVMDISWFPNGRALLACSSDGSIAYVHCGPAIVGKAISKEQQSQALSELYGKLGVSSVSPNNRPIIIESHDFLGANPASGSKSDTEKNSGASADAVVRLPYIDIPLEKQREEILRTGQRKITPVFVPQTASTNNILNPLSIVDCDGEASQSSNGEDTCVVPTVKMSRPLAPKPFAQHVPEKPAKPDPSEKPQEPEKDLITAAEETGAKDAEMKQPDKKRRRTNMPNVDSETTEPLALPKQTLDVPKEKNEPKRSPVVNKVSFDQFTPFLDQKTTATNMQQTEAVPAAEPVPSSSVTKKKTTATNKPQSEAAPAAEPVPSSSVTKKKTAQKPRSKAPKNQAEVAPLANPIPELVVNAKAFEIPSPLVSPSLQLSIPGKVPDRDDLTLSAENDLPVAFSNVTSRSRLHKVALMSVRDVVWIQYQTSPSTLLAASSAIACTASENFSLTIWCIESGTKLHEAFLGLPICFLACSLDSVLTITSNGNIGLWRRPHKFESWTHLALGSVEGMLKVGAKDCTITTVAFTETDVPVVATSDHRLFICDVPAAAWMVVYDENVRFGNYVLSTTGAQVPSLARDSIGGPLAKLQNSRPMDHPLYSIAISVGPQVTPEVARWTALGFLEKQIQLARVLKSPSEYECWMATYALNLVDFDCILRLRLLLDSLMGPPGTLEDVAGTGWEPEVLGMSKRAMLAKLLKGLARKPSVQRILVEYKQKLDAFSRNIFALQR